MRRSLVLFLLVTLVSGVSCSALRTDDPWQEEISYDAENGDVVAKPDEVLVGGSFGRIQLTNFTNETRGFAIDELAIYERVLADRTITISIDEARDGETYEFYDHLHEEEGPRGRIVVSFLDEDV